MAAAESETFDLNQSLSESNMSVDLVFFHGPIFLEISGPWNGVIQEETLCTPYPFLPCHGRHFNHAHKYCYPQLHRTIAKLLGPVETYPLKERSDEKSCG